MNPVLLHADGTDCRHEGRPRADVHADGGALCPAGVQVTHVRFNGQVSTVEQAYASLASIAGSVAAALTPVITDFAGLGRRIGDDPGIRALAAYAAAVDEERRREDEAGPPGGGREAGTR